MHSLLQKKSMDVVNEDLLKPTEYPAADPTYDHPDWWKGTEPETIKHGSAQFAKDEHDFHRSLSAGGVRRTASHSLPSHMRDAHYFRATVRKLERVVKELIRHPDEAKKFACDWGAVKDALLYMIQISPLTDAVIKDKDFLKQIGMRRAAIDWHNDPPKGSPRPELHKLIDEDHVEEAEPVKPIYEPAKVRGYQHLGFERGPRLLPASQRGSRLLAARTPKGFCPDCGESSNDCQCGVRVIDRCRYCAGEGENCSFCGEPLAHCACDGVRCQECGRSVTEV